MKKTVKGAIGVIAAAGLVAGGYFGYGVLGTKAGKVVNEVQSKVKQTVNSKDKKGQKNNTKNMNYSGWYISRISTYLPFYKSSDELTDDVLQEIYISAMDNNVKKEMRKDLRSLVQSSRYELLLR